MSTYTHTTEINILLLATKRYERLGIFFFVDPIFRWLDVRWSPLGIYCAQSRKYRMLFPSLPIQALELTLDSGGPILTSTGLSFCQIPIPAHSPHPRVRIFPVLGHNQHACHMLSNALGFYYIHINVFQPTHLVIHMQWDRV